MVNFLDIEVKDNYIYAIAEDCNNGGVRKKVKVHRTNEEFYIEGGNENASSSIKKAVWGLQSEVQKSRKRLKNTTIAWY